MPQQSNMTQTQGQVRKFAQNFSKKKKRPILGLDLGQQILDNRLYIKLNILVDNQEKVVEFLKDTRSQKILVKDFKIGTRFLLM